MDAIPFDYDLLSISITQPTLSSSAARLAPWQIKAAKDGMARQIRSGLRIADVAAHLSLSETHFAKAFRNSVGIAPHHWFRQVRLAYAEHLLVETCSSVADIAATCGYSDESHFIATFHRAIGTPPGRWRRKRRQQSI